MPAPALRIVEVPHARVKVGTRIAVERTLPIAAKELKLDAPAVRYFRHAIASDTGVREVDARWQRSGTIVAGFADRLLHEIWIDAGQTPEAVVDVVGHELAHLAQREPGYEVDRRLYDLRETEAEVFGRGFSAAHRWLGASL